MCRLEAWAYTSILIRATFLPLLILRALSRGAMRRKLSQLVRACTHDRSVCFILHVILHTHICIYYIWLIRCIKMYIFSLSKCFYFMCTEWLAYINVRVYFLLLCFHLFITFFPSDKFHHSHWFLVLLQRADIVCANPCLRSQTFSSRALGSVSHIATSFFNLFLSSRTFGTFQRYC